MRGYTYHERCIAKKDQAFRDGAQFGRQGAYADMNATMLALAAETSCHELEWWTGFWAAQIANGYPVPFAKELR